MARHGGVQCPWLSHTKSLLTAGDLIASTNIANCWSDKQMLPCSMPARYSQHACVAWSYTYCLQAFITQDKAAVHDPMTWMYNHDAYIIAYAICYNPCCVQYAEMPMLLEVGLLEVGRCRRTGKHDIRYLNMSAKPLNPRIRMQPFVLYCKLRLTHRRWFAAGCQYFLLGWLPSL